MYGGLKEIQRQFAAGPLPPLRSPWFVSHKDEETAHDLVTEDACIERYVEVSTVLYSRKIVEK